MFGLEGAMGAAAISALGNMGGSLTSAIGGLFGNAANAGINSQNMQMQALMNNQNQTFQNNVNVANWAYQDKVNQMNMDFAREQTSASQAFAREQMDFQKTMSNSAYQRATADMKAAGINPLLAYQQGGASTPAGAMGTASGATAQGMAGQAYSGVAPRASLAMENPLSEAGRGIGRAVTSAVDAYRSYTTLPAQKTLLEQQGQHEGQKMEKTIQETYTEQERNKLYREEQELRKAQVKAAGATTAAGYADAALTDAKRREQEKRNEDVHKYGSGAGPPLHERFSRQAEDLGQTLNRQFMEALP